MNNQEEQLVRIIFQELETILLDVRKEYFNSSSKGNPDSYLETFLLTRIVEGIRRHQEQNFKESKEKP